MQRRASSVLPLEAIRVMQLLAGLLYCLLFHDLIPLKNAEVLRCILLLWSLVQKDR